MSTQLTILMPCLNEAETVEACIQKARGFLDSRGINGEVLIADNGSTDGSQDIARMAGARVIDVPTRGYGAALIGGIKASQSEYIIMGDADDSYDFSSLDEFWQSLNDGYELVMGNRFKGGIKPGAMPTLHRYLGNPVLSMIGRIFFKSGVGDFHCGLRGFKRASIAALDLKSPGMEFASEMVVRSTLAGLKIKEVPTILHPDGRSRPPHLRSWSDGWRHLRFLLLFSPRWLFFYPGLVLMTIGAVFTARLSTGSWRIGSVELDLGTMYVASTLVILGYQSVWFALISKVFGTREGLLPVNPQFERAKQRFSLERTIQASVLVAIAGLITVTIAFTRWGSDNFGTQDVRSVMHLLVPGMTAIIVAIQTLLSRLLMSVLDLPSPVTPDATSAQ